MVTQPAAKSARDLDGRTGIFGGPNRTSVLVAIRLLEETYASELAQMLDLRLFAVQRILASLERDGVLITRTMGRTRLVTLSPRYFAFEELSRLLWKMGTLDFPLQKKLATRRRRPRRAGKPL